MHFEVTILLSLVLFSSSLEQVDVGGLCSSNYDCGSSLLYCSTNGVCLCDTSKANFVYEFRHHFDIREPKCEVRPCDSSLKTDNLLGQCELYDANCSNGMCKCPGKTIGVRRPDYLSEYSAYCKDVAKSSVGGSCSSTSPVCDINKKHWPFVSLW